MKKLVHSILIVTIAFSNSVLAADKCYNSTTGRDPYEWVHVPNGGIIVGLFQCTSCSGLRRPAPSQDSNGRRVCEGCGNPFDSSEATIKPLFDNRGGQLWTQARFRPINEEQAELFRNAGPDWACGSCQSRNWGYDKSCTSCGNGRAGNELADFDPYRENKGVRLDPAGAGLVSNTGKASPSLSKSRPRETQPSPATPSASALLEQQKNSPSVEVSTRSRRLIIISSVAAAALMGLGGYFAYNHTHPDPLTGEITDIVKEYVLFKDEETYLQYRNVKLDLAHPPPGMTVLKESDLKIEEYNGPITRSNGYIVQMTYANIIVGGHRFTLTLLPEEASIWKKGDPVVLALDGADDFKIVKPK